MGKREDILACVGEIEGACAKLRHILSEDTPAPYARPLALSSMERESVRMGTHSEAELKREHFAANLAKIAPQLGMTPTQQRDFLDWWCSPSDRNPSEIRAESDHYFNLFQRAKNWVEKHPDKRSRIEQVAATTNKFKNLVDQFYNPDGTGAGDSPADTPDEQ